jgi:hypothetical protein
MHQQNFITYIAHKRPTTISINPTILFIYPTVNNLIPNKIRINPETKKQT